jgi:GT2 family glycosyltransferase
MPIIIGDQNGQTSVLKDLCKKQDVNRIDLDYDCGVTHARNTCVEQATTEFILVSDDDFIFSEDTDADIALNIMDKDSSISVVGGSLRDIFGNPEDAHSISYRRFEKYMHYDEKRGLLTTIPIDFYNPRAAICESHIYYDCDVVLNFALFRRSIFNEAVGWDTRFLSNGEHEDFFLTLKLVGHRVVYAPDFFCYHNHKSDSKYRELRNRQNGWSLFADKRKLTSHLEIGTGLRHYSEYENLDRTLEPIPAGSQIPPREYSYLRIWPNGQAIASPEAEQKTNPAQSINSTNQKYYEARATIIWKIARPFMKIEQYLARRIRQRRRNA